MSRKIDHQRAAIAADIADAKAGHFGTTVRLLSKRYSGAGLNTAISRLATERSDEAAALLQAFAAALHALADLARDQLAEKEA